jgi:SAM-dependent methyltransferase
MIEQGELNIFRALIREGAAAQDVFDGQSQRTGRTVSEDFVQREVSRVRQHQAALCPLLEQHVGKVDSILDVGCGTGGTTVAMALSDALGADRLVGVDPNPKTVEAARVRARGYQLSPPRLDFSVISANQPLPFADGEFSLTTCVSVLEFVETDQQRLEFVNELKRVTRPGGHVYLATPNPYRLARVHRRWLFGDAIGHKGVPWSWPRTRLARAFGDCRMVPLGRFRMGEMFRKRGWGANLPGWTCEMLMRVMPWHKVLARLPN